MSVNLYILKASGRLEKLEEKISVAFRAGVEQVQNKISLPNIDVIVDDNEQSAIPETGVGGSAPSAHLLYIHINPEFKEIENIIDSEIRSTLAHELHHCARWATCGYGATLLEALISEGLADHFDIEVNGGKPKPWSVAIQGEELSKLKEKAEEDFFNNNYNHTAWFFGSEKDAITRWSGYSLGYEIVGEYLKTNNKKASQLVNENAVSFINQTSK